MSSPEDSGSGHKPPRSLEIKKTAEKDSLKRLREASNARMQESLRGKGQSDDLAPSADVHRFRRFIISMVHDIRFEYFFGVVIIFNLVIIIYQADYDAQCYPAWAGNEDSCPYKSGDILWVRTTNLILLCAYTIESILRMVAQRCRYLQSRWNQLDILVVGSGWFGEVFSGLMNFAFLRVARVARLIRAFRFLLRYRELYLLMNGMMGSLRALFFGTGLMLAVIMTYSIILVEWAHPLNSRITYFGCDECTFGFKSVWWSMLTLFKELIAGDAWIMSFSLFEESPLLAPLMVFIVVTIALGIVNLILSVVVECAAIAREQDIQDKARLKATERLETKKELIHLCSSMDTDGSGTLSKEELFCAYETMDDFSTLMMKLEVQAEDLETLFRVLDADASGDLDYEEFCDELVSLKSEDQQTMLVLTRFVVQEIQHDIQHNLHSKIQNLVSTSAQQDVQLQSINAKLDTLCCSHLPQANNPSQNVDQPNTTASELQASEANLVNTSAKQEVQLQSINDKLDTLCCSHQHVDQPDTVASELQTSEAISLNAPQWVDAFESLASLNKSVLSPAVDVFDIMQKEMKCLASLNQGILQEVQLQMTILNDQLEKLASTRKQLSSSCAAEPIHDGGVHMVQLPKGMNKNKLTRTPLPQNMTTQVSLMNRCIWQNCRGAATVLELNNALLGRVGKLVFDLPAACTETYQSSWASMSLVGETCAI